MYHGVILGCSDGSCCEMCNDASHRRRSYRREMHVRRLGRSALLFLVAACVDQRPARLAAPDTVVVNSRKATALPVDVRNAAGRVVTSTGLHYALVSGSRVQLSDKGAVTCLQPTDATIRVTRAGLSTRFVVRCRPIDGFRLPAPVRLFTTDPPRDLSAEALDLDGNPVALLAGTASVRDTRVVVLLKGQLYPKARGATYVDVTAGDCTVAIRVEVIERSSTPEALKPDEEFATTLRLVGGEIRDWRIPPGRYELDLVPVATQPQQLVLSGRDLNCSRLTREPRHQQYSCVAHDTAAVIVRHPESAGTLGADLHIRRWDDSATATTTSAADESQRVNACPIFIR